MSDEPTLPAPRWYRTGSGRTLLVMAGVAAVYLLVTHWAHAVAWLPWLLLAACPLMHLFMHRGHGHGGGHGGGQSGGRGGAPNGGD